MPNRPGFFQLQSPLDLLHKLEADYTRRVAKNPFDVYAAFDFFVTAGHMPDWLCRARCRFEPATKDPGRALEALCKQLANGAKHFTVFDHYDAVGRAADLTGHLMIHLGRKESAALRRTKISTTALADLVLTHWKAHPAIARVAARSQSPKHKG